jgi:prepilin-type N-terminal cleavage/methylation domain-containing protein
MVQEGGFSFIEVMLAMAILTLGILGIMSLHLTGAGNNALSASAAEAAALAEIHMEGIMQADYGAHTLSDVNRENSHDPKSFQHIDHRDGGAAGKFRGSGRYRLYWNVVDDLPVRNMKTIVVTVRWKNGRRYRQFVYARSLAS